jgi:hypothetical protein
VPELTPADAVREAHAFAHYAMVLLWATMVCVILFRAVS